MNNFDLMIEKYRKELMQAKKRSIIKEIEEVGKPEQVENDIESEAVSVMAEPQETEPEASSENKDKKTMNFSDKIFEKPNGNEPDDSTGTLKIQIFAADQVYPVQSAHVVVKDPQTGEVIFDGYSDSSGIVDGIILKTPSAQISQSPSDELSYSSVDILIEHPRFITVKYIKVPIFSGVESIQTVQLIPTAEGNQEEIIFTQSEPENLESAGD